MSTATFSIVKGTHGDKIDIKKENNTVRVEYGEIIAFIKDFFSALPEEERKKRCEYLING